MVRKIRKHSKRFYPLIKPAVGEKLYSQKSNILLNIAQSDRITYSVLRNKDNKIRKIENISYEINIDDKWEWIIRYDDHGGLGSIHRHFRVSLKDAIELESYANIKKYKDKNHELTWVINDIKRNYLIFRRRFLKNNQLDMY